MEVGFATPRLAKRMELESSLQEILERAEDVETSKEEKVYQELLGL